METRVSRLESDMGSVKTAVQRGDARSVSVESRIAGLQNELSIVNIKLAGLQEAEKGTLWLLIAIAAVALLALLVAAASESRSREISAASIASDRGFVGIRDSPVIFPPTEPQISEN